MGYDYSNQDYPGSLTHPVSADGDCISRTKGWYGGKNACRIKGINQCICTV